MIIMEITEDKFGKVMKSISKITEHAECLAEVFEDLAEESYNSHKHDDDDMYHSRYNNRRGGRYSY